MKCLYNDAKVTFGRAAKQESQPFCGGGGASRRLGWDSRLSQADWRRASFLSMLAPPSGSTISFSKPSFMYSFTLQRQKTARRRAQLIQKEFVVDVKFYLSTSSGFLPCLRAPRQANHLFSSGTDKSSGDLPFRLAPGTSSSTKRYAEASMILISFSLDITLQICHEDLQREEKSCHTNTLHDHFQVADFCMTSLCNGLIAYMYALESGADTPISKQNQKLAGWTHISTWSTSCDFQFRSSLFLRRSYGGKTWFTRLVHRDSYSLQVILTNYSEALLEVRRAFPSWYRAPMTQRTPDPLKMPLVGVL